VAGGGGCKVVEVCAMTGGLFDLPENPTPENLV